MEFRIETNKCIFCNDPFNRGTTYYNLNTPFSLCRKCLIKLFIEAGLKPEEMDSVKKELVIENLK